MQDKKMLKIVMFGHKRIPSREGGVEIVVEELATRMAKKGHRVTCYNRAGHHISGAEFDQQDKSKCSGVRIKAVPTIQKKGLAAVTASFFAAIFSAFGKYDVVHIHAEGPAAFCWLPHLMRKRVIVTIHGLDWKREKWKGGFASKYIHFGEKMAAKWADEVIVLSKEIQKYFKKEYNRDTVFIPNGVTRPEKREADLIWKKFGLQKNSYILYLGRLVPEKGEHYLIQAFKEVATDKKLVIAGGASDSDEVQYFGMEHKGRCVGNRVNAYTSDMDFHGGSKLAKLSYPIKTIYSQEARIQLRRVLDDFQPDVCHLNNFNYQLTPSIILEIVKWRKETGKKCKIVFTAHDYQLVC